MALTNADKQRFFSQLSHDIRTPMNGILGSISLIEDSHDVHEMKDGLSDIKESGLFLLALINDVLDISKITEDNFKLNLEPYTFPEFNRTIKAILMPKAKEKNIELSIVGTAELQNTVYFDKKRLQQIFVNLISNAIKFTPTNGKVTLHIDGNDYDPNYRKIIFTVTDNGIGMSEDFIKNDLFKEFTQENPNNSAESGTGLGLTIVKKLVDKMKGTIECKSVLNEGTTFIVTLPTTIVPDDISISPKERVKIHYDLNQKRVLLCEDHPLNVKVATKLLIKKGIIVDVAENGKIGIDKFVKKPSGYYNGILMDVRMPIMDGITATKEMRNCAHPDGKTIPIIAMSANAMFEDVNECLAAGMNAHIAKPVDPDLLYDTLGKYL